MSESGDSESEQGHFQDQDQDQEYDDEIDVKSPEEERQQAAKDALTKFDDTMNALEEIDWERSTRSQRDEFERKYGEKCQLTNDTHGTLLHYFVTSRREKIKPQYFVRWFVDKWPDLIEVVDGEKKTALHLALHPKNHFVEFVDTVLMNFPHDKTLGMALGMQDDGGRNCLHHAIEQKFPSTLKLIEKCEPDAFTKCNSEGKTPLLMAMDLEYNPPKRPRNSTSQTTTRKKTPTPQNAVRSDLFEAQGKRLGYEVINADEVDNIKDKKALGMKNGLSVDKDVEGKDRLSGRKDSLITAEELSRKDNKIAASKGIDLSRPTLQGKGRLKSHSSNSNSGANPFFLLDVVQKLMEKSERSLSIKIISPGSTTGRTPYQYRLYFWSKSKNPNAAKDDVVLQAMKEFCLRRLPREDAIKILYEDGKEKHIEFDLSSLPSSSISEDDLNRLARHLTFEDTLMYVALPKLRIEHKSRENDQSASLNSASNSDPQDKTSKGSVQVPPKPTSPDRLGLTDASIVFQWLRDNGVRRIFKVIVIDDGEIPHSDEVIEEALTPFQIEIWDWKKIDISSETIYQTAGKHIKVIYLYSSGNNAVLRGWACEDGLAKLKLLEQIHLVIRRGFETETRREQDFNQFKQAFTENWKKQNPTKNVPKISKIHDDKPKSYASGFQINKLPEQKQEWLRHMDIFASLVSSIDLKKEAEIRRQERKQAESEGAKGDQLPRHLEDIRVAVIDDGIDGFENDLSGSIAHGVSFSKSSDSDNLIRTYYVSSGGHGTMMARLIRRICPRVKLYVARLEEYKSSSGKRFITASSATEAVYWAITNKVHIISMSWSIEGLEEQDDIKKFKEAVEAAKKANITMFCAFSDQGNNSSEKTYPGAWRPDCIVIGAATARGDASTLVDKSRVDYLFPGEQIIIDSKDPDPSLASSPVKFENGSSISTALAAGTAALLLFITQLVKPKFYPKLQQQGRMAKAFSEFCTGTNPQYFKAQDHFDKKFGTDAEWIWDIDGKKHVKILVNGLMSKDERQSKDLN